MRRLLESKKWASYLHRTAQPLILAPFPAWGSSAGAGRIRLAQHKIRIIFLKRLIKPLKF